MGGGGGRSIGFNVNFKSMFSYSSINVRHKKVEFPENGGTNFCIILDLKDTV